MGAAYLLVNGKTSDGTHSELFLTMFVGATIGLLLSFASDKATSIKTARLKLLFWPAALILFWTFMVAHAHPHVEEALTTAAISGGAGLAVGVAHCLIATKRLGRVQMSGIR